MATVCSSCRWIGTGKHENSICPNCSTQTEKITDELAKSMFRSNLNNPISRQDRNQTKNSIDNRQQPLEKVDWPNALEKGGNSLIKMGCALYLIPILGLILIMTVLFILSAIGVLT